MTGLDPDYVWYSVSGGFGMFGFPKDTVPDQPGLGWYQGEHFKRPDGTVKEELGDAKLIKQEG